MPKDYQSAAERYRPSQIKVLFIAESPPAYKEPKRPSYFYFEDNPGGDMLFATIIFSVFGIRYKKGSPENKVKLLKKFKDEGYFLIDAVEYPINRIGGVKQNNKGRRLHIKNQIPNLRQRINCLRKESDTQDFKIVLIKNLVYECLSDSLRSCGYPVPQLQSIGFPRYHFDPSTVNGIREVISPIF